MKLYMISIPESQDDTAAVIRAVDGNQAANFYVEAMFEGRILACDGEELEQAGAIRVMCSLDDNGGPGLLAYDQPEVDTVNLEDIPAWNEALAKGYEPGADINEWVEAQDGPTTPGCGM